MEFSDNGFKPTLYSYFKESFIMELMIKNIFFKRANNPFQTQLKNDIDKIKSSNKIFVTADKLRSMYKLEKDDCDKLLTENITKTYQKSSRTKVNKINYNAKRTAEYLSLEDCVEKMYENEVHITINEHKKDFPNKISCRLINPSKSNFERISKQILDTIILHLLLNGLIIYQIKINTGWLYLILKVFIHQSQKICLMKL